MAERQESRSLGSDSAERSASRAASTAQQRAALVDADVARGAPPMVAPAQVPPVPTRTADTAETAMRQRLARSANAGAAADDLLVSRPKEEGGGAIPRVRASATGHPIARAASGVPDLSTQVALTPAFDIFQPPTAAERASTLQTAPLPTTTAQSPLPPHQNSLQ
jgi:hypothetical protein